MKLKPIEIAALAGFGWLTLRALNPKGTKGLGHVADWYNEQDLEDYRLYLESGYGKDFTDAELLPYERARLHSLEEAAAEHARRRAETQQRIVRLHRERDAAQARANLLDYEKYLNRKYGRGWHPGLIDPQDADIYEMLLKEVV